jgi:hypothetical protein
MSSPLASVAFLDRKYLYKSVATQTNLTVLGCHRSHTLAQDYFPTANRTRTHSVVRIERHHALNRKTTGPGEFKYTSGVLLNIQLQYDFLPLITKIFFFHNYHHISHKKNSIP